MSQFSDKPSTSTQQSPKESVAPIPDEGYPKRASIKRKYEDTLPSSKEGSTLNAPYITQPDYFAGLPPAIQEFEIGTTAPIPAKGFQPVREKRFSDTCKIIFAEEGTSVLERFHYNDRVIRIMQPTDFWGNMNFGPPTRVNLKFHNYLVVQDRFPGTGATNNLLTEKCYVIVAIPPSILKVNGLALIKCLARMTESQYLAPPFINTDTYTFRENYSHEYPLECSIMCIEKLPFNGFTKVGRAKTEKLWATLMTTKGHELEHLIQLPADLKPLTPMVEKFIIDESGNIITVKAETMVISKFVYVLPARYRLKNRN